ncbi:MAG: Ig-like domain-containing protein [Candidatus Zixiibacteriota bacterium]
MNLRLFAGALFLASVFAATAAAQQDPKDEGVADSAFFVVLEPTVGLVDQVVTAQLYFFNTPQNLASVSGGYRWDNPKLVMDSVRWSPEAMAAFNLTQLAYYRNNRDSTNANRYFQATALRIFGDGLVASGAPKLIATYYFHATTWTNSDAFCIDTASFTPLLFVSTVGNVEYKPIFRGQTCVGHVVTGVLQASPTTLNFTGVAGGPAPPSQTFNISEQGGANIPYVASSPASWFDLTNASGTTPADVGVAIDMTGLGAGDHQSLITVTSPEATNQVTVTVNLHLDQANQPPVLNPIGNREVDEAQLLQFVVSATDPDAQIPALTTSALPSTASFIDNGDGTGTLSWTPTYDDQGAYPVTFTASDGDLTDEETITITVNNVNRAPLLATIDPQQVNEGVNLTFGASATDPDLDPLTLSAVGAPAAASFTDHGDGTATFSWTPSNTDAGLYDFYVIASDGNLADSQLVSVQVIDADGFVVNPPMLNFEARFNSSDPAPQYFNVSIGDGSNVQFLVSTAATWITLDPTGATTPSDIEVTARITGLAAGDYHDSIQVVEQVGEAGSPAAYDPVWVHVFFTVYNELAVTATNLQLTQSEGAPSPASTTFTVYELGGDAIAFTVSSEADWFTLNPAGGTTPQEVVVAAASTDLAPGDYTDSIEVASADAPNSPLKVHVNLTVTPCPGFAVPEVAFSREVFVGETATVDEMININSSTEVEIPWFAIPATYFTFDPEFGDTEFSPQTHMTYSRQFDSEGSHSDTARIIAAWGSEDPDCPSEILIIVNVSVNRAPSADTVIVINTPAVPGQRVGVPVVFSNSCRLTGLGLSLNWTGGMVLDSVSFVGSVIAYVTDKTVAINNDLNDVTIVASVGAEPQVPIGSQQLMATLWFALRPEIEAGTYSFGLGAYPPLLPGDVYFYRDCGEGQETEFPEYIPGAIIVGTTSNYVCGYVVDPLDNEIEGATVELWDDYPLTEPLMSTMSSSIGGFAFDDIMIIPFDLYAYKDGYYPGYVEDINFGDKGIKIVLTPLPETVTPTSQWVDYFCPENPEGATLFLGVPVPVGAIVEAYTQNNLLVGQTIVSERGKYGFMPVYRASDEFNDNGARTGDQIHFTINGMDAVATGNTIYPADYAQVEVCLEVRGTTEKVCALVEGWNLISWNVNTTSDDILEVLAPIMDYVDVVLGFEQGGLTFDPDLPMFSTLWNVDHLSGYWVRIVGIGEIDLNITGLPVLETTPIPLSRGWNLVSYLREESWDVETALMNVDHLTLFAYGFPNGEIRVWQPGGQFNQLETFDPCNGYWIKTSSAGTLIYSGAELAPGEDRPMIAEQALSSGPVTSTNWINLYSRDLRLDGQRVTAGTTVRAFSVDGDHLAGSFTLTTDGQFGFMPVYADAAGENQVGLKAGDEYYLTVNDIRTVETLVWTGNGDRIEVTELAAANSGGQALPTGYSLEQNYPNPFNPSTVIEFSVPVTGYARLEIFNVLGASVAVVFDGQALAGEHKIVWDGKASDGTPTASGVYFYRLTADNYTETRKMMLLK